jgi:type IV pilus assembly protein PilW
MTAMRGTINSGQPLRRRGARGVTLVELLVAMVISLIAVTAIFQVFSVFEGQKRTTMGGGEAQTNGALSLFTLERELRQSGYGVNSPDYLGCNTLGWDETTGTAFTLRFAPVEITQGAGEAPDTLTVLYGSSNLLPQSVNLTQTMASDTQPYRVTNRFGFQEGDVVILAETGLNCSVGQASSLPGVAGQLDLILHASGNYTDPATGLVMPTRYNKSGGIGVVYTFNAKVFNLGSRPSYNIYTVQNGQLAMQQMLSASSTAPTMIYDGIVQLQAQYGRDTNGDGIIDVFDEFNPVTAADWATILAVRIGVIARSGLYEKTEVTPVGPIKLWPDSAVAPTTVGPIWTPTANDRHYRYKVFHTVVPVRNMIWRP